MLIWGAAYLLILEGRTPRWGTKVKGKGSQKENIYLDGTVPCEGFGCEIQSSLQELRVWLEHKGLIMTEATT